MKNNNFFGINIYEAVLIILFIISIWEGVGYLRPDASIISLRLYAMLGLIFIYLPLRFVFLIFFPSKEENE